MIIDYEQKLTAIAESSTVPDQQVHPAIIDLGTRALQGLDARYGPESDHPLGFHYGPHSLGVVRRNILLVGLLYEFIPEEQQPGLLNLGMAVGSKHDDEQLLGPGKNERASADNLLDELTATGVPELNTPIFMQRAEAGSLATTVKFGKNEEITQTHMRIGEPDPFIFISGFGDINGIAVDGRRRMFNDAARLAREKYGPDMTLREMNSFMLFQEGFLRKRLNDHRIKGDIAYHWPDPEVAKKVYKVLHHAFHANIIAAHSAAVIMRRRPVKLLVNATGKIDSALGNPLTNTLYEALTIPD
jgi:hypothetical protein